MANKIHAAYTCGVEGKDEPGAAEATPFRVQSRRLGSVSSRTRWVSGPAR